MKSVQDIGDDALGRSGEDLALLLIGRAICEFFELRDDEPLPQRMALALERLSHVSATDGAADDGAWSEAQW